MLTMAIGVDPDTLDPMAADDETVQNIVQMVVESLAGSTRPASVQPNCHGLGRRRRRHELDVALRTGVTFSTGHRRPRGREAEPRPRDGSEQHLPNCGTLSKAVKSVDVLDPGHVRLTMSMPLASDVLLGLVSLANFGMVSPRAVQKGENAAYAAAGGSRSERADV